MAKPKAKTKLAPSGKVIDTPKGPKMLPAEFTQYEMLADPDANFEQLVVEYRAAHNMETAAKATKKAIAEQLLPLMIAAEAKNTLVDQFVVQRCNGRAPGKYDPKKLVELGVPADTVQQAWVPGAEYEYLQVKTLADFTKGEAHANDSKE